MAAEYEGVNALMGRVWRKERHDVQYEFWSKSVYLIDIRYLAKPTIFAAPQIY